uniref:Uncharacterized protein n=1 Tax=Rhizophora mucronata TaxID=61149 RepID=A0A2P2NU21_RHIMU
MQSIQSASALTNSFKSIFFFITI